MNKLTELREKKLDNKGFSLVELIIVIAIMAVLIGVLAPQYLKYVERSRESADLDNYDAIVSAIEIYNSDPANTPITGSIEFTAINTAPSVSDTAITTALSSNGVNISNVKTKSTKYGAGKIEIAADKVTITPAALATALGR